MLVRVVESARPDAYLLEELGLELRDEDLSGLRYVACAAEASISCLRDYGLVQSTGRGRDRGMGTAEVEHVVHAVMLAHRGGQAHGPATS